MPAVAADRRSMPTPGAGVWRSRTAGPTGPIWRRGVRARMVDLHSRYELEDDVASSIVSRASSRLRFRSTPLTRKPLALSRSTIS